MFDVGCHTLAYFAADEDGGRRDLKHAVRRTVIIPEADFERVLTCLAENGIMERPFFRLAGHIAFCGKFCDCLSDVEGRAILFQRFAE